MFPVQLVISNSTLLIAETTNQVKSAKTVSLTSSEYFAACVLFSIFFQYDACVIIFECYGGLSITTTKATTWDFRS